MREMPTAFRLLTDRPGAGAGAEARNWELGAGAEPGSSIGNGNSRSCLSAFAKM